MIQLRHTPFAIDFVENHPVFEIQRWPSAEGVQLSIKFRITYNDGSTAYTPELIYNYQGNTVNVGVDILKDYFKPTDIPHYQDGFVPRKICNNEISYVLIYGDSNYANRLAESESFKLVNGYVEPYRWVNNYPDWVCAQLTRFYENTGVDIYGQNNHETVYTYRGCEQYLYLRNYSSTSVQMSAALSVKHKDGTISTPSTAAYPEFNNPILPAESIVRLRTDIEAFGNAIVYNIKDILQYTISLSCGGRTITRTYNLQELPYNSRYLLMKNRLNLFESFVIFNVKKELTVSGERIVQNYLESYNVSDTEKIFTARTGLRTEKEISMLGVTLGKKGNMLVDGQWADYIAMVPGTWTIIDQREDLLEVEFQYKVVKREAREAGYREINGTSDLSGEFVVGAHARIESDTVMDVRI